MRLRFALFFVLINFLGSDFCATILKGNSGLSTTTFNFSVGPCSFYGGSLATSMITGAGEQVSNNTFSVSYYSSTAQQFIPLGVTNITLNNTANQSNPLTGQKIKSISIHDGDMGISVASLVIDKETITTPVPASERFFVISDITLPHTDKPTEVQVSLTQSDVPNDSAGAACGYTAGLSSAYVNIGGKFQDLIIGAVTQSGNAFGTGNSGIALAAYKTTTGQSNAKSYTLTMLDAQTGVDGNRAVAVNTSASALKVGDDLTQIDTTVFPAVNFHWDFNLQRLFIALNTTAAAGATNGARALAIGRFSGQKLILESIIPDSLVLASTNNAIVASNNGRSASIYKLTTMRTSTGLDYLIVNGGNNAAGQSGIRTVPGKIFALPLVNERTISGSSWLTSATHATIAAKNQTPTTTYNEVTHRFLLRQFRTPATTVDQLPTETDTATIVGAGLLPIIPTTAPDTPMVIKDLFVAGDTVYTCLAASYAVSGDQIQEPGTFQSRAIFDEMGRIAAWTPWQRVNGSDDVAYGGRLDARNGDFWILTGTSSTAVNTVKKTLWGAGAKDGLLGGTITDASVGLVNLLCNQFPANYGGIQALNDFDANANASGVPHSGLAGQTVLLASGYHKFAFVLTGDNSQAVGTIKPYTGDFTANMASGTSDNFPAGTGRVFIVTGSVLNSIGPLTAQTIFSNNTHSWIAVGGMRGLAILSDADGQGFLPSQPGVFAVYRDLPTNFTFKRAGNYSYIQKVIGDGQYLYVLTTSSLERITIDPAAFASGNIQRTILATTFSLGINKNGCFSDVIVGDKLALLATSNGLYRIANGYSIKTGVPQWAPVPLGESIGPVYNLSFAASSTDYNTGLANHGQVFALAAYQGLDNAQIYRLYTHEGTTLSNTSLQTIGDCFIENIPSYFGGFGQMRNSYNDDGSVRFHTRPAWDPRAVSLFALPSYMRIAVPFETKDSTLLITGVGPRGSMEQPVRISASGAWLLPGNLAIQVNE